MVAFAAELVLLTGGRTALESLGSSLLAAAPKTLLWFASAAGLGRAAGMALRMQGSAAQVAIGAGLLLCATQWAGTLGLFQLGLIGGLMLLAPGWWMLGRHLLSSARRDEPVWLAWVSLALVALFPWVLRNAIATMAPGPTRNLANRGDGCGDNCLGWASRRWSGCGGMRRHAVWRPCLR
jgi:hypothetical protein